MNVPAQLNLFSHGSFYEQHTCQSDCGLMEIPNHGYHVKFPRKQLHWDYNNH